MESGVSTPQNHAISKTYLRCQTTAVTHTHAHTRTHTRNSYLSVYTFNCLSVYLSVGLWDCGSVCQPAVCPLVQILSHRVTSMCCKQISISSRIRFRTLATAARVACPWHHALRGLELPGVSCHLLSFHFCPFIVRSFSRITVALKRLKRFDFEIQQLWQLHVNRPMIASFSNEEIPYISFFFTLLACHLLVAATHSGVFQLTNY